MPEPVYGISREETERMGLLLAQLADSERQKRHVEATRQFVFGAAAGVYFGLASRDASLSGDEKTGFAVLAGVVPAFGLGSGLFRLTQGSDGEKLYERFRTSMAAPGADQARIAADTEASLREFLRHEQSLHTRKLVFGWAGTALFVGTLAYVESTTTFSHDARLVWRGYMAAGAGAILAMTLSEQFSTSPTEKLIDLW